VTDSTPDKGRFSIGRSIFFSALLFVLFFGGLEAVARIVGVQEPPRPRILLRARDTDITFPFMRADPELFWSPRPGYHGLFLEHPVSINSLGLRGPEPVLPKPAGRRRVACFGDSITFGYGVGDDETYAAALGRRLEGQSVDVINAGVTGYTSYQVLGLLRRVAPQLRPDVATICIGWNDGTRRPLDDAAYARRLSVASRAEGWLDRSYLFRGLKSLYLRSAAAGAEEARTERVPLDQYRANLAALVDECRQQAIRPVFIALPHRKRAGEAAIVSPYPGMFRESATTLGVPFVSATDLTLESSLPDTDSLFVDALHMSPSGNERMAEELARALQGLGLVS
jgi:lysophospholipase L1-like esterase